MSDYLKDRYDLYERETMSSALDRVADNIMYHNIITYTYYCTYVRPPAPGVNARYENAYSNENPNAIQGIPLGYSYIYIYIFTLRYLLRLRRQSNSVFYQTRRAQGLQLMFHVLVKKIKNKFLFYYFL